MTITKPEVTVTPRSISAERAAAEQMPEGYERDVALLRADELAYARRVLQTNERVDARCSRRELFVGDGHYAAHHANPNPPFMEGSCCERHHELARERTQLNERAGALGVRVTYSSLILLRTRIAD